MDTISKKIELVGALLLYGANTKEIDYCSHHRAIQDNDGMRLSEGVPVTMDALESLASALGQRTSSPILHERVLVWGQESLGWWLPSGPKAVFFNTDDAFLRDKKGVAPCPTLIFKRTKSQWRVGALKGNSRPGPNDMVYHSPFLNVSSVGWICTGTAELPKSEQDNPESWEKAFFDSRFTHSNFSNGRQVEYEGSIYKFWSDMMEGKFEAFPESALIESNLTVSDFLSK